MLAVVNHPHFNCCNAAIVVGIPKATINNMLNFSIGMSLDIKKHGKLEPRWRHGVYLGVGLEYQEVLVGTEEGVSKT